MHTIYQEAMAIKDQVIGWRRAIHQNPEVGMDLPNRTWAMSPAGWPAAWWLI